MARWFGLPERASRFLSEKEADQIYSEGMLFINTHLELTEVSCRPYEQNKCVHGFYADCYFLGMELTNIQ